MGVMTQEAADQVPFGFHEGRVEADGFELRVMDNGSGEALVFFHTARGIRLTPAHAQLAEARRVIAIEAPGFGRSPVNQRTRDLPELARTMMAAAAALGLERFDLMGHSFGAKLALWTAIQNPDAIRALALIAPSAIRPEDWTLPTVQEGVDPEIGRKQAALVDRLFGPPVDDALEQRMGEIACPVLALFGTRDELIPTTFARRYKRLMPKANVMFVYDAGHGIT
ncbi:MAG TPA: alpha/beta fold hydrolase, partial [Caulobacteraceae bacterium]|nr:alpha/beta fold hydrolase [Caulobacteraceae bacterium]